MTEYFNTAIEWGSFVWGHFLLKRLLLVLILGTCTFLAIFLLKRFMNHAEKKGMDPAAKPLVYSIISYAIYIFALLLLLHILGVNTAGIVAMVGAASLAVGLALKDTLTNIASGILLLFLRPFKAGNYIECGSVKGCIVGIGLFNTTLRAPDGLYVSAPNSSLWGSPIINYSKNPTRRLEITVGIDYEDSPDQAMDIMRDIVANEPLFLTTPEPQYYVSGLEDNAVNVSFRAWVNTKDFFKLRGKCTAEIHKRFAEAGISIPFPQRTVHLVNH